MNLPPSIQPDPNMGLVPAPLCSAVVHIINSSDDATAQLPCAKFVVTDDSGERCVCEGQVGCARSCSIDDVLAYIRVVRPQAMPNAVLEL
jgi:hypothetical protein